jgi:hypothetical protein
MLCTNITYNCQIDGMISAETRYIIAFVHFSFVTSRKNAPKMALTTFSLIRVNPHSGNLKA